MYTFFVFIILAFAFKVAYETFDRLVPLNLSAIDERLDAVKYVGLAILVAWGLNYSVFGALGQNFRWAWMAPVATGVALVAAGKVLDVLVGVVKSLTRHSEAEVEVSTS